MLVREEGRLVSCAMRVCVRVWELGWGFTALVPKSGRRLKGSGFRGERLGFN